MEPSTPATATSLTEVQSIRKSFANIIMPDDHYEEMPLEQNLYFYKVIRIK